MWLPRMQNVSVTGRASELLAFMASPELAAAFRANSPWRHWEFWVCLIGFPSSMVIVFFVSFYGIRALGTCLLGASLGEILPVIVYLTAIHFRRTLSRYLVQPWCALLFHPYSTAVRSFEIRSHGGQVS